MTRRRLRTDPCPRGRHADCQGAEDGGPIYPGDVYLCDCACHALPAESVETEKGNNE